MSEPFAEVRLQAYCQTETIDSGRRYGTETLLGAFDGVQFSYHFRHAQTALAFRADSEVYFEYYSKQIRPWMPAARISFSRSVGIGVGVPKLKLHR